MPRVLELLSGRLADEALSAGADSVVELVVVLLIKSDESGPADLFCSKFNTVWSVVNRVGLAAVALGEAVLGGWQKIIRASVRLFFNKKIVVTHMTRSMLVPSFYELFVAIVLFVACDFVRLA